MKLGTCKDNQTIREQVLIKFKVPQPVVLVYDLNFLHWHNPVVSKRLSGYCLELISSNYK